MSVWSWVTSLFSQRDKRFPYRPRPWWRRMLRVSSVPLLICGAFGCEELPVPPSWHPAFEHLGMIAPKAPERVVVLGLCDPSLDSPCADKETFRAAVRLTAEVAAVRPGSVLSWTILGASVDLARQLGEKVSPPLPQRGLRVQKESIERFVKEATDYYLAAAAPAFAGKALRASPLTATVGRLAVADTHGIARRFLVIVSDAREVSDLADLECLAIKKFSKPDVWAARTARFIPPVSLKGADVFFAFTTVAPTGRVGRCPAPSLERVLTTQELWRAALSQAGAERVVFANGLPDLAAASATAPVGR